MLRILAAAMSRTGGAAVVVTASEGYRAVRLELRSQLPALETMAWLDTLSRELLVGHRRLQPADHRATSNLNPRPRRVTGDETGAGHDATSADRGARRRACRWNAAETLREEGFKGRVVIVTTAVGLVSTIKDVPPLRGG